MAVVDIPADICQGMLARAVYKDASARAYVTAAAGRQDQARSSRRCWTWPASWRGWGSALGATARSAKGGRGKVVPRQTGFSDSKRMWSLLHSQMTLYTPGFARQASLRCMYWRG